LSPELAGILEQHSSVRDAKHQRAIIFRRVLALRELALFDAAHLVRIVTRFSGGRTTFAFGDQATLSASASSPRAAGTARRASTADVVVPADRVEHVDELARLDEGELAILVADEQHEAEGLLAVG
jgi:hypothetical protein